MHLSRSNRFFKMVGQICIIPLLFFWSCSQNDTKHLSNCTSFKKWQDARTSFITSTDYLLTNFLIFNGLSEDMSFIHHDLDSTAQNSSFCASPVNSKQQKSCLAPHSVVKFQNFLYLTCSMSQEIQILDANNFNLVDTIYLGNAINPTNILIKNEHEGFVTSYLQDKILIFDPTPGQEHLVQDFTTFSHLNLFTDAGETSRARPGEMVLHQDFLYVSLANLNKNALAAGPGLVAKVDLSHPHDPQIISSQGRNTISLLHSQNLLYFISAGDYIPGKGYKGNGVIDIFDLQEQRIIKTIHTNASPQAMVIDQKRHRAFVSNNLEGKIISFDTETYQMLPALELENKGCTKNSAMQMTYLSAIELDQHFLYALEFNSDCFFVFDLKDGHLAQFTKTGDGPGLMFAW